MRVFDLKCAHDHRFEGWFASGEAYEEQLGRKLISCPVCGDTTIDRLPSAPHLNLSAASRPSRNADSEAADQKPQETSGRAESLPVPSPGQLQALWLNMVRDVMRKTENVGESFAEEARRIHYNEAPERAIRGVASADQIAELSDEGIDVMSLPVPDILKEPLQ